MEDVDTHKGSQNDTEQPGRPRRRHAAEKPRDREGGTLSALPKHPAPIAKAGEGLRPWGKVEDFPGGLNKPPAQRDWLTCSIPD